MSKVKEKKQNEKMIAIKEQVEYYLGDNNLKQDQFFHNKISENANGYLDLELLLKCNKIKNAGWSKEDLIEGIKLSDELELDSKNEKVRRKDNKPLPELVLLSKKRPKPEKEEEEEEKKREPVVLMFESEEDSKSNWRDICNSFKAENPDLNVIYSRFKDKLGHIVVLPDSDEEIKFKDNFTYDDVEYKVKKCVGEDLINFYKDHGKHYEDCVAMHNRKNKKGKGKKDSKNKNKNKNKKEKEKEETEKKDPNEKNILQKEVALGDEKFSDISVIKTKARKIITDTKDGEKLKEKDQKFILDLLKYHHNCEEKSKNLDYITVGKPENYDSSRCFIIVNKKNEKHDFSVQKCIDNLFKKINEK